MPTSAPSRRKLKPPPNYSSRAVQLKLFVMVAACMGVLYLAVEAANPNRWRWFAEGDQRAPPEAVDTRLAEDPLATKASSVPGAVTIADPLRAAASVENATDDVSRTLADFYAALRASLEADERQQFARLLSESQIAEASETLLARCDETWDRYRTSAVSALTGGEKTFSPDEITGWLAVLDEAGERWQLDRASLAAVLERQTLAEAQRQRLAAIRERWNNLALAAIKDDTVHRAEESDAWFRLLGSLNRTTQAELERQSVAQVNFIQLFKQSDEYRGKLVRIRGRVVQAKPVPMRKNDHGIERQYMLWLHPNDAPRRAPIVVYTLELPDGFPPLDDPNLAGGYTSLREDVEITGYFFKRWAYYAHDGLSTAPLILTKTPRWIPGPDLAELAGPLPSLRSFLAWVVASALFGIVVAAVVYWRSRTLSPALATFESSPASQRELAHSLTNAEAGPSVEESLRQLEERDREYSQSGEP